MTPETTTTTKKQPKYAVIHWQADNRYRVADAVGLYVSEKVAEKAADKLNSKLASLNAGGFFVRDIEYML